MDYESILSQAEDELRKLEAKRAKLLRFVEAARELASAANANDPVIDTREPAQTFEVTRAPPKRRPANIMGPTRNAVAEILREAGRPMETGELLPLVTARGIEVGGRNAVATLSARLSNSERFKNNRGIGWWFVDEPLPGVVMNFEEAEEPDLPGADSSASNQDEEGGESHAPALDLEDL